MVSRSLTHHAHHRAIELGQLTQPRHGVIVGQQVGGAVAPPPADAHSHTRIGLDVADVVGMVTVLGDHPELVVHHAPAHRGAAGQSAFATRGFDHGHGQLPAPPG